MPSVYVKGKEYNLNKIVGSGGEADIYYFNPNLVAKLFKKPSHPDFNGLIYEQVAAKERLEVHQKKLRQFPSNLSAKVVQPIDLITDKGNYILGYTMPFIKNAEVILSYGQPGFRKTIGNNVIKDVFLDIHKTVCEIHANKTVVGDFNDLNILVKDNQGYFIDADSFQYGPFKCCTYTVKYCDPLNLRLTSAKEQAMSPNIGKVIMHKEHNDNSDWYAFAVMLMQSFLFIDPYGGVYVPKDIKNKVVQSMRSLKRITVFNSEVRYPKVALHYRTLPDDLLDFFQKTFEKDKRGEFPIKILENINWTTCSVCGAIHARSMCPNCKFAAPVVKKTIIIHGTVKAETVFPCKADFSIKSPHILYATFQNEKLRWLYYDRGEFKREDGEVVSKGLLETGMRFRISDKKTLIAKNNLALVFEKGKLINQFSVDQFGSLPVFDVNSKNYFWINQNYLRKQGMISSDIVGQVLSGNTLFWVGEKFGFGFYKASEVQISFVFNAETRGINDNVKLPRFQGQLIDSTCVFGKTRCWFFTSTQEKGKTINRCFVINSGGGVEATAQEDASDDTWLSSIRGKVAMGDDILSPSDYGIKRLELEGNLIKVTREFPDTEPFVSNNSYLFVGNGGVYVVNDQEILHLFIN